jgi:hypothetical protein
MLNRWFKRELAPVPCVDLESVKRLAAAEHRIRELETMLQAQARASVVELDGYRAARDAAPTVVELDAYRAARAAPALVEVPAVEDKPAKAARKPRAAKVARPAKLDALAFWRIHGEAVDAIRAEYGDTWRIAAPFGKTVLVTTAANYRATRKVAGTEIKYPRDMRFPAASYWPGGAFPEGVTVEVDYPREDPATAILHRTGKPPARTDEWHLDHGYVRVLSVEAKGHIWVDAIAARQRAQHAEAIEAEREFKRLASLERAALTYGPQPLVECEFADAAD